MSVALLVIGVLLYIGLVLLLLAFLRGAATYDDPGYHYERNGGRIEHILHEEQSPYPSPAVEEALHVALNALDRVEPQAKGALVQADIRDAIRTLRAVLNKPTEKEMQR